MISDNQLTKGIQSKRAKGLGAEPVEGIGGEDSHEPGGLRFISGHIAEPSEKSIFRFLFLI